MLGEGLFFQPLCQVYQVGFSILRQVP